MDDENAVEFTAEETEALTPSAPEPRIVETPAETVAETVETVEQPVAETETEVAPEKHEAQVPSSRLREEAAKRREAEERYQRDIGKLQERLDALQRAMQPKPEETKAPDWDTAPLDAGKALAEKVQRIEQQTVQQQQEANFKRVYSAKAAEFAAETPDFQQAYQHYTTSLVNELRATGLPDPEGEALRLETVIAINALNAGINPAQRIYELGKLRGYAPKAAEAPSSDATKTVETLQRGTAAARSIGGAGAAPANTLTLNRLLEMDDDDFAKVSDRDWRKAMGQ
jgi:uncharacterized membrane-anchored protein YhcB (DUF1043 family)